MSLLDEANRWSALRAYLLHECEQLVAWKLLTDSVSLGYSIVVGFSGFYLRERMGSMNMNMGRQATLNISVNTDSDVQDHSDKDDFVKRQRLSKDNDGTQAQDIVSPPPPVNPLRLAFAKGNRRSGIGGVGHGPNATVRWLFTFAL
jgi:hypothetical protein